MPTDLLDGLDLEVQRNERQNQTFQVLHQVVKGAQTFRVVALVDVDQRANL
jgi:hypothetical protein